jgi:hypothetical protein
MFDRVTVLDVIDRAFADHRLCEACGAPTVLRNDGNVVILECSNIGHAGILDRIEDFLMPHTKRVVIDLSEEIAA